MTRRSSRTASSATRLRAGRSASARKPAQLVRHPRGFSAYARFVRASSVRDPRPGRSAALRRLRWRGGRGLCCVFLLLTAPAAAALRPLRRTDGVAGSTLRRVRGEAAFISDSSGRRRVRRSDAAARLRVEGTRAPPTRRSVCRLHGGDGTGAARGCRHVRPRRPRADALARPQHGGGPGTRARASVGAPARRASDPIRPPPETARASAGGAAGERPRVVLRPPTRARSRRPRRRRLYDRGHGRLRRDGAPAGGREVGRRRHIRPRRSFVKRRAWRVGGMR